MVEEFDTAKKEVLANPGIAPLWQAILAKYSPAFIGECQKAIDWMNDMTVDWLKTGMLKGKQKKDAKAKAIVKELADHTGTKSHSRHFTPEKCREIGLKIINLEDDQKLQEAVLSVHHSCMVTFSATQAVKMIENHNGTAHIKTASKMILTAPTR